MKVLIISHNPITTYHNMGKTLLSLFSAFKKEELCQLYIYPTIPDVEVCNSFFRITDKDVLHSYFSFRTCGNEIDNKRITSQNNTMFEVAGDERLYRNPKNKKAWRMLARDFMWKCSGWYTTELRRWLDRERPTHIFVAPGTAKFLYDIALKIAKTRRIPIVAYICDDYYFGTTPKKPLDRWQTIALKRKIRQLLKASSHIVGICRSIVSLYEESFGIPAILIMTGASIACETEPRKSNAVSTITYMGNIRINRYFSLAEIGAALDQINADHKTSYSLQIYTAEKDANILSVFEDLMSVKLCGFVSGKEYEEAFRTSELFLHTESFDSRSVELVRYSVSTKIADILASGTPLIAYGPADVASISHLAENQCAAVVTEKQELKTVLLKVFQDAEYRRNLAKNGLETAKQYHDSGKASSKLYHLFDSTK